MARDMNKYDRFFKNLSKKNLIKLNTGILFIRKKMMLQQQTLLKFKGFESKYL